jgi:hypothetical protein
MFLVLVTCVEDNFFQFLAFFIVCFEKQKFLLQKKNQNGQSSK